MFLVLIIPAVGIVLGYGIGRHQNDDDDRSTAGLLLGVVGFAVFLCAWIARAEWRAIPLFFAIAGISPYVHTLGVAYGIRRYARDFILALQARAFFYMLTDDERDAVFGKFADGVFSEGGILRVEQSKQFLDVMKSRNSISVMKRLKKSMTPEQALAASSVIPEKLAMLRQLLDGGA